MKKLFLIIVIVMLFFTACSDIETNEENNISEENNVENTENISEDKLNNNDLEDIIKQDAQSTDNTDNENIETTENNQNETTQQSDVEYVEKEEIPEFIVHVVQLKSDGFSPDKLTINTGDKIKFKNMRDKAPNIYPAIIIGGAGCEKFQSSTIEPGESYEFTFNEQVKRCIIVDGVMTTQSMTLVVN